MSSANYDPRGNANVADVVGLEYGANQEQLLEKFMEFIRWLGDREPVAPGDPFIKFATRGYLVSKGLLTENDVLGNDDDQDPEIEVEPEMVVVHAREMFPSVTNGCGTLTITELASTKPNLQTLEFVKVGQTAAQFMLIMPPGWVGGSFQFRVYWSHSTGGSTFGTAWRLRAHSVTDGETMSEAFSGSMLVTDTGGTADDLYISPESDPVQISGTQAKAGDLVMCEISRIVTDSGDTLNIPARLHAIRFNVGDAPAEFPPTGDPYWADVVLLVQDGADGTYDVQDRSTHADSVTIANYAEWDSASTIFGVNQILYSTEAADIPEFVDSDGSRFGRDTGEEFSIETWVEWNAYPASSGPWLWLWWDSSGPTRYAEMYLSHDVLYLRIGSDTPISCATLAADTPVFVQFFIDASDDYFVDVDGVQVATGAIPYTFNNGGGPVRFTAAAGFSGGNAYSANGWSTPLRVTKGVMRPRGVVPTDVFPTSA